MEPFEKQLVPILLVVMPVLAILAAALSALLLSTVWWFSWASWNPHVSDVPATCPASDLDEQPCPAPGGDRDGDAGTEPRSRDPQPPARPKTRGPGASCSGASPPAS
jgi:hypothetical protein